MCGIFCSISRHDHVPPSDTLSSLLTARGPDASNRVSIAVRTGTDPEPHAFLTLHSTVLALRGDAPVAQPYRVPDSDSTLCWNGEAWKIRGEQPHGNDTRAVAALLHSAACCLSKPTDARAELVHAAQNISAALARISGPYAFVFYDAANARLFFGRDFLGRRSLLIRATAAGEIMLTSVSDGVPADQWAEVEADGIYCVDLSARAHEEDSAEDHFHRSGNFIIVKVQYTHHTCLEGIQYDENSVIPLLSLNREIPSTYGEITESSSAVNRLGQLLEASVSLRVSDIPRPPKLSRVSNESTSTKLAILFSGGLDCTTLARIAHEILAPSESIDLLNVAFENPRAHRGKEGSVFELCPDRVTGRNSYEELRCVCPTRDWRFVAIDIPYSESLERRDEVIRLMHPHNTEMDLSIAHALHFAARGQGLLSTSAGGRALPYTSSARVLLSGLGADELFAGYTRHATAFRRSGHHGLLDEMELDIGRLGKRNLGRDDRVICHWGKEVRFPFLDEDLVRWALASPVTDKCDFMAVSESCKTKVTSKTRASTIEPGKKVLRCLAAKLGMSAVAKEKKRAIQFGAKTAKMETGKTKGTTLLS